MSRRGVYRGIYSSLLDDADYQRLSPRARHVLLTARQCAQAGPAAIYRYYLELLAKQAGYSVRVVDRALTELDEGSWTMREGSILWVRNALRYDPSMNLSNPHHRQAVTKWVQALPKLQIVLTFCDYYSLPYPFDSHHIATSQPSRSLILNLKPEPDKNCSEGAVSTERESATETPGSLLSQSGPEGSNSHDEEAAAKLERVQVAARASRQQSAGEVLDTLRGRPQPPSSRPMSSGKGEA